MKALVSGYQKSWLRFDAEAGITTAAVVIPQSMAYASIAGLPVEAGLYVALVPMFVYALLGSSRPLSVSSTSTLAILTATQLTLVVPTGDPAHLMAAAAALALLVGGFQIVAGLLRFSLPGLLIMRTEGRMTFASAPQARERLAALIVEAHPKVVILECSAIPDFEYTALRTLTAAEEKLREAGILFWLSVLNPLALEVVRRSSLGQVLGPKRMFFSLRDAVKAYEQRGKST
jgi:MFS superfamily sulfate permease-like transporter